MALGDEVSIVGESLGIPARRSGLPWSVPVVLGNTVDAVEGHSVESVSCSKCYLFIGEWKTS